MHYRLSFLDNDGSVQDVCEAEIATVDMALRWMRVLGAAWGLHSDWSSMELWCQGRCVARSHTEFLGNPEGLVERPTQIRRSLS